MLGCPDFLFYCKIIFVLIFIPAKPLLFSWELIVLKWLVRESTSSYIRSLTNITLQKMRSFVCLFLQNIFQSPKAALNQVTHSGPLSTQNNFFFN